MTKLINMTTFELNCINYNKLYIGKPMKKIIRRFENENILYISCFIKQMIIIN